MSDKKEHICTFDTIIEKPVLLRKYRPENGKIVYDSTTGKDIIKFHQCTCGKKKAYDLVRMKV